MTERERLVEDVVKYAKYAAGVFAVKSPEQRGKHEHDLKVAVDRLLEHDAAKVEPTEYRTVTDPEQIRAVLDRLKHDTSVRFRDSKGVEFVGDVWNATGLPCVLVPPQWHPHRDDITSLTYLASDDPQATPAGEAVTDDGYTALGLIRNERRRQQAVEGWTVEHDDGHTGGELAEAAACYALPPDLRHNSAKGPMFWPWDAEWWKPSPNDRIRELAKAGALIVAEIERLQRAGEQATPTGETPCNQDIGSIREQASAWESVCETLNEVDPDWCNRPTGRPQSGIERACAAIRRLAKLAGMATTAAPKDTDLASRVAELERRVDGLTATLNTTSAEANRAHVRISDADVLLREAGSWLSLCAHRLASETPKVHEPSRADILAVCAKIDKATREPPLTVTEVSKANRDVPLAQRVDELDVWASSMTDIINQLRREVNEMRGTRFVPANGEGSDGPCPCKSTTPSAGPKPLPFGCVVRQKADGKWQIENAAGTHWWSGASNKWANYCIASGWAETRAEALADFHATYGGKVPPPDRKPASEGISATIESRVTHFDSEPTTPTGNKYEVEMCPHDIRKNRVVHDGLFMLVQNGRIRWTSDAWTPLDRVDAETFASVLRNAQ